MAAVPKHRRSNSRQGKTRSQPGHKAKIPSLVKLASGKRVPAHTVTKDNPVYKGTKFLKSKKAKAK